MPAGWHGPAPHLLHSLPLPIQLSLLPMRGFCPLFRAACAYGASTSTPHRRPEQEDGQAASGVPSHCTRLLSVITHGAGRLPALPVISFPVFQWCSPKRRARNIKFLSLYRTGHKAAAVRLLPGMSFASAASEIALQARR